jgi:peptidoglycan hydrolase-like protein with peptidoglycan-binding domain
MEISQLRSGDSGDAVAHLHSLLELHGVEVSTEELNRQLFGPSTRVAVKEFQKANGIRPTAQVGQRAADLLATLPVASTDPDATIATPAPSLDGENVSPALESTSTPAVPVIPTPPTTSKNQPDSMGTTAAVDPNPPNSAATLLNNRIATLTAVLTDKKHQQAVDAAMRTANGDLSVALDSLKPRLPDASLQKITFAHSLADLASDRVSVVKAIVTEPGITNLRDVALHFNIGKLAGIVDTSNLPADISAEKAIEEKQKIAVAFRQKLFVAEPTAVLQRMVLDAEIPIADATVSQGVAAFLDNQPDFNIRTTSIYTALKHPEAFKDIAEEHRAGVVEHLKTIQRVQSLSPVPEAVPILINANLTSAFGVAEMPESSFLRAHGEALGEETALQVYTTAINSRIRNEQALITMRDSIRGTGLAILDREQPMQTRMDRRQAPTDPQDAQAPTLMEMHLPGMQAPEDLDAEAPVMMPTRIARMQAVVDRQEVPVPLNLEQLFGDMDFCECEECTSVYSPAAYFVELLQYLRNNNLDSTKVKPDPKDISDTPLEKLFRRRPDLGCLELTCKNTFTVLPYIDLVNEVMERFVVHLDEYDKSNTDPNQRKVSLVDTFNVEDETTSELLAEPQHTNYQAYCILKSAVYPFTLPYHQPIDATRIFLKYLDTSRYELLDVYRSADDACANAVFTPAQQVELKKIHGDVVDRAVDAEFLGMTQEEYIILTREAFWPKRYFDVTLSMTHSEEEYRQKIGVKPVHEYYGYMGKDAEKNMLSINEAQKLGLTFVKKQFLPRTGIQYIDLVEILKTQFINPNFPQGKALTILESIRFSYRYLMTQLVDSTDRKVKFAKIIEALENPQKILQPFAELLKAMRQPDPCQQQKPDRCLSNKDLEDWVYCYFDRIGKLIVLEAGEGPQLPIEGQLIIQVGDNSSSQIGELRRDGTIWNPSGTILYGQVSFTIGIYKITNENGARVYDLSGVDIGSVSEIDQRILQNGAMVAVANPITWKQDFQFLNETISIQLDGVDRGYIRRKNTLENTFEGVVFWLPSKDTCDLDKVRLTHLDGSSVTIDEYDRFQRFIRLWRKLGWTIDETDKALVGLSAIPSGSGGGTPTNPEHCEPVGFDVFSDDCAPIVPSTGGCNDAPKDPCDDGATKPDNINCPKPIEVAEHITPDFLHQLVAVIKLLDLTGFPLIKLLTFWADISTIGEKSLYSRLFLTHNLLGIDKVFKADQHGNYLTQSAKITEHLPVLMAALKLKADDITAMMSFLPPLPDALTVPNLSVLYRHSLLAKALHVKVADLPHVIALFGNPFRSAWNFLSLIETWGKMEDAGFTFRQLNYIIRGQDDKLRPLAPAKQTILQITKTLYDGLNGIDRDHKDIPEAQKDEATAELVRTKIGLLFEPAIVEKIIGLLEGTTVYTTNAPLNLTITIPDAQKTLAKKLKYSNQKDATPPNAGIQVIGILTPEEQAQAKALSSDPAWAKAIDRVGKQPKNIFNDALLGVFPEGEREAAKTKLLAGDVLAPDGNTALDKRFYLLQHFLPFLRQRLAHRFIVDTLANATSLPSNIADALLSDLLTIGATKQPAINVLEGIKAQSVSSTGVWKGYLIPPTDEAFTFVAISDTQPLPLLLDGESIAFKYQQEDPSNVWSTDPTAKKLKSGKLYWLEVSAQSPSQLQWKTATLSKASIPTSALLPDYTVGSEAEVFTKLSKAALLINGFNLTVDEVTYWQAHANDFDGFDLNAVTLQHWLRLQAYTALRSSLPKAETNLLDLFEWAAKPVEAAKQTEKLAALSQKIADVINWKPENIEKLLKPEHFDLKRLEAFHNEVNLVKLQKAIVVADKIAVDIDRLFNWAKPGTKFWACHQIAEDIRNAIRARYDQTDWEQVVKPLNDQLRENQKLALIAYLLVQPDLIEWGVVDADSLFEFFLIDVQMDACMETSRIKQAISSVQLFVQRCFLGLEDKLDSAKKQIGVPNEALDRQRWEWMQRYRVWEANRKVFLYPENWIEPALRDDKSPFYKEFESELLQKDINPQTVQDAMKSYLFKVDEVANLKVVGLFLDAEGSKLHIFSRTRNAPYFFYYRYFDTTARNWYPWEKMQVDIPNYDVEGADGQITKSGTYLTPVVWNNRLLVFFPQFMKKTAPNPKANDQKIKDSGENKPSEIKPIEYWEIKMGWSEYRNGKWTQRQVSSDVIYDNPNLPTPPISLPDISSYEFIPRLDTKNPRIVIVIHRDTTLSDAFQFTGSQISKTTKLGDSSVTTVFHYVDDTDGKKRIFSLQATNEEDPPLSKSEPYFKDSIVSGSIKIPKESTELYFYHPFAHELLGKLMTGNLDDLFKYYRNNMVQQFEPPQLKVEANETYGENNTSDGKLLYNELKRSYSIYNWEATFHAPMQLVDRLLKSQQFEQALKMCHYIFNPYEKEGTGKERFWQFPPFKVVDAESVLEKLFMNLIPNKPDNTPGQQINEWRDNPFQPHVIARSRPVAYMKWVVMKYIEILLDWGDHLFRQDTIETLNQATQLYVLAAHIYGPRGQLIPKRGKIQPQTYNSLLDKWDAFGNAMVELELAFPFSNQTPFPIGVSNGVVGLANVFGFATSLYFCIPDNPKLRGLRDTIDDRLFKIRHCQNIEGIFRKLPLFEPPIDPALLVQAAAQGLSLSSVLNDLNSPVPNYRFYYLLQKALELCSELKSMGNAFLSAKKERDAETLSNLRAGHESTMQNLLMEVKKHQLDEAGKSLDALKQSRKATEYRMQHYLGLIGEDVDKIPGVSADFNALPNQIEKPIDEGDLKLIGYEKEEMDKANTSAELALFAGIPKVLEGIFHAIPSLEASVEPIGIGIAATFGGTNLAGIARVAADVLQLASVYLQHESSRASRKAGFLRQLQDRVQQANTAGYEIKNIDKQMLTQQIRISIANQEITNQQKNIDHSQEVEEFLRNKYTNEELYTWMEGQIQTLHYQVYTLTYDLFKKAVQVFRFDRGITTFNINQFGYWDASRDGLLAGERLYIGLKQLEAAYQEKRGYDYEVTKHISLRQINPMELIKLKETGTCEFALPEVLFDMDYPGHYMRRIKSVAITIPCVVGPYTSLNATLRLLKHKFRTSAIAKDKNDYLEKTEETDDRFSTVNIPITSIACSTGQNDSGVFELNFKDERYLPFEGAGVISDWWLELPSFKQFDYDTISDAVIHIRYTSVEGGDKLKKPAADTVTAYIKSVEELSREEGLFAAFDLKHEFSSEWHKAMNPPAGSTERVMMLNNLNERLPIFTKGRDPKKILATDLYLFAPGKLSASLMQDADMPFTDGPPVGATMKSFVIKDIDNLPIGNWKLKIQDMKSEPDKLWLVVRYVLQ